MNDAYNRIYRFNGRNELNSLSIVDQDYNRPVPFPSSQLDQDVATPLDSANNQDVKIREQFSAPAARSRKSKSKPLILPPPAIEARQIIRTSKNHKTEKEKNIIKEPEQNKEKESEIPSENQRLEKLKASYMLTPFSPMLTWSPSLPSKNTSVRTQFFLANGTGKSLLPFVESTMDQKIGSAINELNEHIGQEVETSISQRNTSALQEEYSFLLNELDSKTAESYDDTNNAETLQNDDSEELSELKDITLANGKNVNNDSSVKPFQLIRNGLKLDAITLHEDFIHMLQSEKDDVHPEVLESYKEDKPYDGTPLYYENEYSGESDSLQNDYSVAEKAASSLDEKFLIMLTESSSEENLYEETKLKQDEAFAILSGFYSEQEKSSRKVKVHSTKKIFQEKNEKSSFEYDQEESSSYSEYQSAEECTLEKKVSLYDIESSSEEFILYKGEFSRMLEKAYAILEISQNEEKQLESSHENQASTIQEIFSHLIDEAFESYESNVIENDCCDGSLDKVSELLRSFSSMLNDPTEPDNLIIEGSCSLDENCCLAIIESSSQPIELCSSESESDTYESSCIVPFEESHSTDESCRSEESSINFEHHCDESEESSSIQEETSRHEESPNLQDVFEHELLADVEPNQEKVFEHKHECVSKIPKPTVKIPVLVGKLEIDIDLFDIFPLPLPIKKITKMEWAIKSLDTHVVLPSNTIFIKGTLISEIEYVNPGEKTALHSVKLPIKFDKTSEVCWLSPPDMPEAKTQKEFIFNSNGCEALDTHYVSSQSFTEKIESQLRCINFVWHNDLTDTEKPGLQIQGRAILEIDLLQEQYVDL